MVRRPVARGLTLAGFRVLQATNTAEARREIDNPMIQIDAIVLDLLLPGTPGWVLLWQLRQDAPSMPVIILTGVLSDDVDLTGARKVLLKPIGYNSIIDALDEVLHPVTGLHPAR